MDNYFSASPIKNESVNGDISARLDSGRLGPGATRNPGDKDYLVDSVTVNSSACSPDQPSSNSLLFLQRVRRGVTRGEGGLGDDDDDDDDQDAYEDNGEVD